MASVVPRNNMMAALKDHPAKLYVETTTRCNLRCSMCVKQAEGACISEGDMPMDVFRSLEPAFPHLDGLILNGIGEPLLTPDLLEMIRLARAVMPATGRISFQTNGMLLTPQLAEGLVAAGLDTVCLSVDVVGEDGIFHGGEDIGRAVHAFSYLQKAAKKLGRQLSIGVEFVLMRETADALPRSLDWAADQGAEFALVTHMLPYGESMAEQELFNPNTEQSMAEFALWQQEAEERGVDLSLYFDVLWKFYKSREEAELVRFIMERQNDALSRNIPINLASLMEWSTPEKRAEQEHLARLLADSQAVANARGMELTLPPVAATHERQCDFVEQGVAHVTAAGDVRPCYFLWHEYSCFMDGGVKKITPRTFGNALETSILEIWNSEPYRAFRGEVLEYAYPYCSNCSVVPCSDVTGQGHAFEQDCFGLTIPCGHCLWCMGGVRCLL